MSNKILVLCLLIASCGLGQSATTAAPAASTSNPSNDELLVRGKKIFVVTNSFYVKKEQLESSLIKQKELRQSGIQVVQAKEDADLILTVVRAPFRSKFPFTFTDRERGIIVFGGSVNSLFGTVAGRIADELADRLKEINKQQNP